MNWKNLHRALFGMTLAVSTTAFAQESTENYRSYDQGPLTAKDFRGKRMSTEYDAFTRCNIRYDFRYRYQTRGNVTTVKLAEVNVFAVVMKNESWNASTEKKWLMDHEQGHFDIAQIHALQTHLTLLKQIKSGSPPSATGNSEQSAAKKLQQKLNEIMQVIQPTIDRSHADYDRQTKHGLETKQQTQHRANQLAKVKFYQEEIKRISGK